MKYLAFILLSTLLFGCSDSTTENNGSDEKKQSPQEETQKENNVGEEVIEDSTGSFKILESTEDVGTYQSGPLTISLSAASLVSGTFTDDLFIDNIGREDVEYLNLGTEVSTTNENIVFTLDHLSLTTSTGEEIKSPNDFMSDGLNEKVLREKEMPRFFVFMFDKSKAKEIDYVTLHVKSPVNDSGEKLGEDLDIEIPFK
ncbi:hypothetical protein GLW00_20095 [Halobacillus litoralis]|uniref:DUF4352 domain-containing protein n=1 Tax=Halobacillus litoralis TaxID=45668 RepID=A0A845FGY0_9BACI|nr:hypothetical protein [Halobacillus litoralis]MYL73121.1 hypothetical protein [Halobacillus litoralis]